MIIKEILCDKKKYLDLLLIGDEQESMILKYLDKSRIFGLYDPELKAICAVEHMPDKSEKVVEIKNIAGGNHQSLAVLVSPCTPFQGTLENRGGLRHAVARR